MQMTESEIDKLKQAHYAVRRACFIGMLFLFLAPVLAVFSITSGILAFLAAILVLAVSFLASQGADSFEKRIKSEILKSQSEAVLRAQRGAAASRDSEAWSGDSDKYH
jgi:hypothetical protein